jgi:hypothetical protein
MFRGWDEMDNEKTKKLHVHKRNPKDSGEWHLTILQSFINPKGKDKNEQLDKKCLFETSSLIGKM